MPLLLTHITTALLAIGTPAPVAQAAAEAAVAVLPPVDAIQERLGGVEVAVVALTQQVVRQGRRLTALLGVVLVLLLVILWRVW